MDLKSRIKGIWKQPSRLFHKIEYTLYEFKLARQRFFKGYDESMVWGADPNLLYILRNIIVDFKDINTTHPPQLSTEEWEQVLCELIGHLDHIFLLLNDEMLHEIPVDWSNKEKQLQIAYKELFDLLGDWFMFLWD